MSEPTHYILMKPSGVFVKEAGFFRGQGGLTQEWGKEWRPVVATSIEAARAMGQPPEKCRGFWRHCRCSKCMARDRELDKTLDKATPAERRKLIEELGPVVMAAKGIKP